MGNNCTSNDSTIKLNGTCMFCTTPTEASICDAHFDLVADHVTMATNGEMHYCGSCKLICAYLQNTGSSDYYCVTRMARQSKDLKNKPSNLTPVVPDVSYEATAPPMELPGYTFYTGQIDDEPPEYDSA